MSHNEERANLTENQSSQKQPEKQTETQPTVKPFYRQFTSIFVGLFLTIILSACLTYALFYQNNHTNSVIEAEQLIPLQQQLLHIKTLHKADQGISNLLAASNAENFVEAHNELVANNSQLLLQGSTVLLLYQQWQNEYKLAEDIVSRLQDSYLRNQQLKQNSIIQLQLMLLSVQSMLDKQNATPAYQQAQLLEEKITSDEVKLVQQVKALQQIKAILTDLLLSFEQLSMHTSSSSFEHLRLKVEQLFVLQKQLPTQGVMEAKEGINKQFDAFKNIVLTKQSALAKWQGYIRLAQDFRLNLGRQQQKIRLLIDTPIENTHSNGKNMINVFLSKFGIYSSAHNIMITLTATICFLMYFFFFLLWQLHRQLKVSTAHSVTLIKNSFHKPSQQFIANCSETLEILKLVKEAIKPLHNEVEYQTLAKQYQSVQQLLSEEIEKSTHLIQHNEQYEQNFNEKNKEKLQNELNHYASIEAAILSIIQKHQVACINPEIITKNHGLSIATQLSMLCQQLAQFRLALSVQSGSSRLLLNDINLVTELEAALFNKQQEQQAYNNQLFMSCDEQLQALVKIDFRLFQQLISLFIDIAIADRSTSQLHLQVQLQDKSVGQQLVSFSARVKVKSLKVLPDLVTQLVRSQSSRIAASPSVEVFSVLLAKQHGGNVVAQLMDDGYQLSFELPLATTSDVCNVNTLTIEKTKIVLLSANAVLAEIIEKEVLLAKGNFERLSVIESIEHYLDANYLSRQKIDVLVVASDIAINQLKHINEKIKNLPHSLKPKLMIIQSQQLTYEQFGFYSQAENIFCSEIFIKNIQELLASTQTSNLLLSSDIFSTDQYSSTELPLLLGVHLPQKHQNLHRLLNWLGLRVQVVSHESAQKALWKTGRYCVLITEFIETAFLEMIVPPQIDIGVFSLTSSLPKESESANFANWHRGKISKDYTLAKLIEVLSPWLKVATKETPNLGSQFKLTKSNDLSNHYEENNEDLALIAELSDLSEEQVITEVAEVYIDNPSEAVFDFSRYLHNQGSAELALFMLDEYTQDNHLQLNALIDAIKTKKIEEANAAIAALTLNAKILTAPTLQVLCSHWAKLFSRNEIPNHLEGINTLIKDTRRILNDIDSYAQTL